MATGRTTSRQRNWQRYARKGTTTARGYGSPHQREGRRRRKHKHPSDPCCICGRPLGIGPADLAHDHINGGYLPGLAHAYCNRAEGASRGNRMRAPAIGWAAARRW